MKKLVSSADLGGAPITKADLREVFNDEIWDALEALLAPFNSDTEGLIISGCAFSNNAGNFDMTAGIVYLNGEFMRIAAVTNQSYTKYIAPATPTSDSRVFGDSTSHAVTQTKTAGIVGSAPGAGQYITISSLTISNARKLNTYTRPACITTAKIDAALGAGIVFQFGLAISVSGDTLSEILITHNLGTTNYIVQLTPIDGNNDPVAVNSIGSNSFKIINPSGAGRNACFLSIFKY